VSPDARARLVKDRAQELGFDSVGITDLSAVPHQSALRRWLDSGMAGSMRYMHRQLSRRLEPERIVPGTDRAVVLTKS
jgi:epoxyqueuosine reductase